MDSKKQIILYGAGVFGKKALSFFGSGNVAFFADGNPEKTGMVIEGKRVISREELQKIYQNFNLVISVDARKAPAVAEDLNILGIQEYTTYLEQAQCLKKPEEKGIDWYESFARAMRWMEEHSIPGQGIINNTDLNQPYPEVTGYFIPSLLNWGFRELALKYAEWLCKIQKEDGSWYDADGKAPYVFDTAQILKGLLSVQNLLPDAEKSIRKGCRWILSQMQDNGQLITPSTEQWDSRQCSDLIHLYCVSPLMEAGYKEEARHIADYYIQNRRDEILDFSLLSHFYAYVMEALCDIGEIDLARQAMDKIAERQEKNGMVSAYKNVNWVCSTGLLQFAVVWYKLGDLERGNRALNYSLSLQNESGGWFGSYPTSECPKATDWKEYPDYFPKQEISWAVKYFLDALYYKCMAEFDRQAYEFPETIEKQDGRYQFILQQIKMLRKGAAVLDAGCGKGRYLKNIMEDVPDIRLCGVDLSKKVLKNIPLSVEVRQGTLCCVPYPNESFDLVYAVESLEHVIAQENAVKELLRVTKSGGRVIVLDKNQTAMGTLEVDSWEKWFNNAFFENIANKMNCDLDIQSNISYERGIADGLFNGWILRKQIKN